MALTLDQLQGMRDAIITAIAGGTLRVDFEGRGVTYRSVVEMQAALTQGFRIATRFPSESAR